MSHPDNLIKLKNDIKTTIENEKRHIREGVSLIIDDTKSDVHRVQAEIERINPLNKIRNNINLLLCISVTLGIVAGRRQSRPRLQFITKEIPSKNTFWGQLAREALLTIVLRQLR